MAQLNDLLVMGQSTLLGPIGGPSLNFDTTIQLDVGHSNECNFIPATSTDMLYVNYRGGINKLKICNGTNTGVGGIWCGTIQDKDGSTGSSGQVLKSNGSQIYWGTDNNTTYTFSGGTNKFTVTPSGGSAQEVTITPSIINNITGTGTSGYLAKFNGQNTITSGPQLGNSTTTYLRNDGAWATPTDTNTTYTFSTGNNQGQLKITPSGGSATNYDIKDLSSTSTPTFAAIKIGDNGMLGTGSTINSLICESAINTYIGADAQAVWLGSRGNAAKTETSGVCFDGSTIKFWCPGDSNVLFIDSDSTTSEGLSYVGITAASYNASSDKRLKTNIQPFEFQKSILDLPIYKYDFINGAKNQIGCIAQDLQKICPEIVNEDENGYLSIQESKIVYLLIDEIKKLKEEINYLKQGD